MRRISRAAYPEKVAAILPAHAFLTDEPDVGLVDERGRLQTAT